MSLIWLVGIALSVAIYYGVQLGLKRRPSGQLPPGPRPKPILGNITDLPAQGTRDWEHWIDHKRQYGPISSLSVLGQTIVIINDHKIATGLLNLRSAIHSSRPNMPFASEMVGWEEFMAFQGYTEKFRAYRKAVQPSFGSQSAVAQFNSLQEVEAHRFLFRVLRDPQNLAQHIRTEAGASILKIAYGYTIEPFKQDHLVHITNLAMDNFGKAATPGAWLVDIIPVLKYLPAWFPGAGFKRIARDWKRQLEVISDKPYAFVKSQMESGNYVPSYLSGIFDNSGYPAPGSEKELVAKFTAASLYTGGADTTVSSIECFYLAMALFPDVQRKAQEEIDRVLGPGRLPKMTDRENLPYINAVMKEVLRWHPVAPMGIPHMSTEDDTWDQYFIPKGSLIMPNIWAMMHDPDVYHDPMSFKPDRFLGIDGRDPEMDPRTAVFGFGRRVCPGRFFAENTVYLNVAQSLAVFNISNPTQDGVKIESGPNFNPGVISHPAPFQCDIKVRNPAQEDLILSVEKENPWEPSDAEKIEKTQY